MPTARELLEQADALMRRNRTVADDDFPVLTDAVSAIPVVPDASPRPAAEIPTLVDAVRPDSGNDGHEDVREAEEGDASDWLDYEPGERSVIGDEADSIAVVPPPNVRKPVDQTLLETAEHEEIDLTSAEDVEFDAELGLAEALPPDEAPDAGDSDATIEPIQEHPGEAAEPAEVPVPQGLATFVEDIEIEASVPVGDGLDAGEWMDAPVATSDVDASADAEAVVDTDVAPGQHADEPIELRPLVDAARAEETPDRASPIVDAGATRSDVAAEIVADAAAKIDADAAAGIDTGALAAAAVPAIPAIAAGTQATPISADAEAAKWDALAEEVRIQVLQRIDLFTDTGLREQLGARLRPIVDRASADLVATINQHVGELLRTYVAEAIEREIERWRRDH